MKHWKYGMLVLGSAVGAALWPAAALASESDPYQVFAQARNVWAAQQYPPYLTYTVAVHVSERGVAKSKHYHLAYNRATGTFEVNPVSDEELAAPPTPSGFIFHLQPRRQNKILFDKRVGNPGEAVDYLGVPMVSPTYSFGLAGSVQSDNVNDTSALIDEIRKQYNDPSPPEKIAANVNGASTKTIASVIAHVRDYVISLFGIENINGHSCYHLHLQPRSDPQRLRLREVWVDTQSFATRQLVSAGNFSDDSVRWLVTFAQSGGGTYIASETALAPVGVGSHRYERASVSFEAIAAAQPPAHPGSFFVTKQTLMIEPEH